MRGETQHVLEAARRIRARLIMEAGGRLPRSRRGWVHLCARLGVPVVIFMGCAWNFTARLVYDERLPEGWLISYNGRVPARRACRWLAHELAEFLAIRDFPSLFDDLPQQVYHYTGGSDPTDARHRIARRVEELCFRSL